MLKILENYKWLILIVLFGAVLRFGALSQMPPSLNLDEISHGSNAYSILKTGHDEWGQFLPIANFRAYGDYPLPLNLYLTIPFEVIFGLNPLAIRLPHALLGTLTIIPVYFLTQGLIKNKKISLFAALLTAIDPWFLFPSRAVFQSNLSVFFLIAGMAAFFYCEKKKWLMPISFLFLGLTLFSYHSTRIFLPIFLFALVVVFRKYKYLVLSALGVGLILLPNAAARANVVFILDQGAVNQIENLRNNSNSPFKKLIYNKVTYLTVKFGQNYINYFSPNFLFLKGGTQYQFSVPDKGLLYLVSSPFFYIGILFVFLEARKREDRNYKLVLIWLLLAPIPAAITQDQSAVIRATTMLPIPEILVSIGLYEVFRRIHKYEAMLSAIFVFISLLSLENYLNVYAKDYRINYSWSWQYGYDHIVNYSKINYSKYDNIIVSKAYGEPHEYFLFFLNYDPAKYMNDLNLIRFHQSNWYWVDRFDKFWFVNDWQVKDLVTESKHSIDCAAKKCLLITTPNNSPKGFVKIDEVRFLDGRVAFEIYRN